MKVTVSDKLVAKEAMTVEEMAALAPERLRLEERVPGVQGEAFDLKAWYAAWVSRHGVVPENEPTHVQADAADEFRAVLPWAQADRAVMQYAVDGAPLDKGFPIRLYVPDGSSACLNVKSIIGLRFLRDASLGEQATYGFVNSIPADALWKPKQ
ncbi:hypothetical protein B5M42_008325 [Paenibacillus athensensis]|uniref:Molybdopterin-dependent oxidoreductase n=1 Tax=Paenibacillus athensensis TaxID=1967502 RepID=A0A4Y8PW51_9BACL|nr:hypothetical protein [Paenibacillus athensensis]MCD1258840.1 hypothetical protein [Paenibacillus athensensis]